MFYYFKDNPDMEWTMIDSTIIRAHACAAGYRKNSQEAEPLGRSKGGFSTTIHALVDALDNPLKFILSAGQRHDITKVKILTDQLENTIVLGDAGNDANHLSKSLIPKDVNRNACHKNRIEKRRFYKHLYVERHAIECFFVKFNVFVVFFLVTINLHAAIFLFCTLEGF